MIRRWPCGLVFLLGILTDGCVVGPDYEVPQVATPGTYADAASTPERAPLSQAEAVQGDLRLWWTQFHDPELTSLIARALNGNLDLKAAVSRIREARELEISAGASSLPQINADGSANNSHLSKNSGLSELASQLSGGTSGIALPGDSISTYVLGFDSSWELDFFGGTRRAVEVAGARAEQAVWIRRDSEVTVAAEVANDYLMLRALQRQIAIAESEIERQQRMAVLLLARYQFGFVNELDVREQETRLSAAIAALPDLATGINAQIQMLGVLLGGPPESLETELTPPDLLPSVPPSVPVGLPSDLLRRRPDIRAAERALAASHAQIGVAVADLYPKVDLTGAFDFVSLDLRNLLDLSSRQYSGTGAIVWPVFDGGKVRANIRGAKEENLQALYAYRKSVLVALQDVEDALTRYGDEQQKNHALREALVKAQGAVDIALAQYSAGLTDFSPVLSVQGAVFSARTQIARSDGTLDRDLVSLYKALGGGWPDSGAAAGSAE